jgi:hypothetical protein
MPKKPTAFKVLVTASGIVFPPAFHAAVLSMQRYRKKHPEARPGEVQLTLDYGEDADHVG